MTAPRHVHVLAGFLLMCFALAGPVIAQQAGAPVRAAPAGQPPVSGQASGQSAPATTRSSLKEVLRTVEQEHGVRVMDPWGVLEGLESRVADVRGQPVEAALRRILADFELIFFYPAAGEQGTGRLQEVWVYPPGMLDRNVLGARSPQALRDLAEEEPSRRAAVIEEAVFRDALAAKDVVLQGLRDGDESVRARTLVAATSMGVPVDKEQLLDFLRNDPSEAVRVAAVDALVMISGAQPDALREIIGYAERDPSPVVQAKAAELAAMVAAQEAVPVEVLPDTEPPIENPTESPASPLLPADSVFSPPLR